jgi:hypothetical protein
MVFETNTEIAIYLAGGYSRGYYEVYRQIQEQLNYEMRGV